MLRALNVHFIDLLLYNYISFDVPDMLVIDMSPLFIAHQGRSEGKPSTVRGNY